jgi:cell division protein FtsW (lipid II flippase)
LGLLGALLVILLFALFAYRGLRIALMSRDSFGTLLATGITSLVVLQALLNTAVVVAVAPATGVTLPFISYGGSSLVTVLGAVGILAQHQSVQQSGRRRWSAAQEIWPMRVLISGGGTGGTCIPHWPSRNN